MKVRFSISFGAEVALRSLQQEAKLARQLFREVGEFGG
jgi:hypothetical protein